MNDLPLLKLGFSQVFLLTFVKSGCKKYQVTPHQKLSTPDLHIYDTPQLTVNQPATSLKSRLIQVKDLLTKPTEIAHTKLKHKRLKFSVTLKNRKENKEKLTENMLDQNPWCTVR